MCGHDVFEGRFRLLGFEGKVQVALPDVLFGLSSHARPEEPVVHKIERALQAQMANLIMASSESYLPLSSWQEQLKEGILRFSGPGLSVQDTLFEQ